MLDRTTTQQTCEQCRRAPAIPGGTVCHECAINWDFDWDAKAEEPDSSNIQHEAWRQEREQRPASEATAATRPSRACRAPTVKPDGVRITALSQRPAWRLQIVVDVTAKLLSRTDMLVLLHIEQRVIRFSGHQPGFGDITQRVLAEQLKMGRSTVQEAIRRGIERGHLMRWKNGRMTRKGPMCRYAISLWNPVQAPPHIGCEATALLPHA